MKTPKTVLVIEDEPIVHEAIKRGLEASARYEFNINLAINPRDYLSQEFHKRRFDVSIVDLNLAASGAYLLGFRIIFATLNEHPGSLAIVYSGHPAPRNIVTSMRLGAAEFVSKADKAPHELVKHVEDLFDGQQQAADRHERLEELAQACAAEWQQKYAGQHVVLVEDRVVTSSPIRLEAMLNYDDLRVDHPEWPEMPDFLEVIKEGKV